MGGPEVDILPGRPAWMEEGLEPDKAGYSLNSLLSFANVGLCFFGVLSSAWFGQTAFVGPVTAALLCLFGLENGLLLWYERKHGDPFVLVLVLISLVFYMGRVVTLMYDPFSPSLRHDPYFQSTDLDFSLVFIILANAAIWLGLSSGGRPAGGRPVEGRSGSPRSPGAAALFMTLVFLLSLSGFFPAVGSGRLQGYVQGVFFPAIWLMLFSTVFLLVNYRRLSGWYRAFFFSVIALWVVSGTLAGSRASILMVSIFFLLGSLAMGGTIVLRVKTLLWISAVSVVGVVSAVLATGIRLNPCNARRSISSPIEQVSCLAKACEVTLRSKRSSVARDLLYRLGFLDCASDLIVNRKVYEPAINPRYYLKSLVDNCLSPGFTIFGAAKVAVALGHLRRGESLSVDKAADVVYRAEMPTIYGESYVLFRGYWALPFLAMVAYGFKKLYLAIDCQDAFLFCLGRTLTLFVFHNWLNSMGMDWIVFDLLLILINLGLYHRIFMCAKEPLR
jgi:hypothetical protein